MYLFSIKLICLGGGGGFDSFYFRVQFKRIILINNNLAAEQFIDTNIVKYSSITLHLALFKTKYPTKSPVVHCYMKIRQNAFFFLIKGLHAET